MRILHWLLIGTLALAGWALPEKSVEAAAPLRPCTELEMNSTGLAGNYPNCVWPPITATLGTPSTNYTSTSGTQTGRVNRDGNISHCDSNKSFPGTIATAQPPTYTMYAFNNSSPVAECVTIHIDTTCTNNLFVVAYLGSFDPANIQPNYLGDMGSSPPTNTAFSVTVPAGGQLALVAHNVNVPCTEPYTLTVSGLPYPFVIESGLGVASAQYPGASGAQTNRLLRNGNASQCGVAKSFPGITTTLPLTYTAYTFVNTDASTHCLNVVVHNQCNDNAIFAVAYLNSFNPNTVQTNYVGDAGSLSNQLQFGVDVPAGAQVVVVVHQSVTGAACDRFLLMVAGLPCVIPIQRVWLPLIDRE